LQTFAQDPAAPLDILENEEASVHAEAKAIMKRVVSVHSLIAELDAQQFYGEEELWQAMSQLLELLQRKLKEADKRR